MKFHPYISESNYPYIEHALSLGPICIGGDCDDPPARTEITTEVKQKILNETDIEMIKKNINTKNLEVLKKTNQQCFQQSAVDQNAKVKMKVNLKGAKGANITGSKQDAKMKIDVKCLQVDKSKFDVANNVANEFTAAIGNKFDTQAMNKLQAQASEKANKGALALDLTQPPQGAKVDNKYDMEVSTKVNQTMRNIIRNTTNQKFDSNKSQDCINKLEINQAADVDIEIDASDSEDVTFTGALQNADVASALDCLMKDESKTSLIDEIANKINETAEVTSDVKMKTDIEAEASKEDTVRGIDDVVTAAGAAVTGPIRIIMMIVGIVVVIAIIGAVIFLMSPAGQAVSEKALDKI